MLNQNTVSQVSPINAKSAALAENLRKARLAKSIKTATQSLIEQPTESVTDGMIQERLQTRFNAMDKMVHASFSGLTRSLIISGPAGLGKSYSVMKIAEQMQSKGHNVKTVSGMVRATGLYKALYENRFPGNVVIFDDADVVWFDDICLNLMKKACDMTKTRRLDWLAETRMEDEDGERLPTSFDFEGTVIFITNLDFDAMMSAKHRLAPHFEAMISRSMYLDLGMKTRRDYLVRMKMVLPAMLSNANLSHSAGQEVMDYIETHLDTMRELSLRMVSKILTLMMMDPIDWRRDANVFCLKNG